MTRKRPGPSGETGAALVEFALVLPMFFGILLGVVTTGIAFYGRLEMTTAAQEGARVLYLGGTAATGSSAATAAATGTVSVHVNGSATAAAAGWKCITAGDEVEVRMTRPATLRFLITDVDITMRAKAVTRCA